MRFVLAAVCFLMSLNVAAGRTLQSPFEYWLTTETVKSVDSIMANIAPLGTPRGFVIASPSMNDPNYYFHWTRDAALTMWTMVDLEIGATDDLSRARYADKLDAYVGFTRQIQQMDTMSGTVRDHFSNIGEPKFNTDGSGFTGEWGRPQADGPALRVIAMLKYMEAFATTMPKGLQDELRAAIDADLEYIVFCGQGTTYDIWEETKGHHFYTEMLQRRALLMGAEGARSRGQVTKGSNEQLYRNLALKLEQSLVLHWDEARGYLVETLGRDDGTNYKVSNLDSGVILASLHAAGPDGFYAPWDEHILATAVQLKETFRQLYPINRVRRDRHDNLVLGVAFGRYPEDRYDGAANIGGNPWVLITLAMAELDFRVARMIRDTGTVMITRLNAAFYQGVLGGAWQLQVGDKVDAGTAKFDALLKDLLDDGDAYLARVRYHTPVSGELSEQVDRNAGTMTSAFDLTWSYAAFLTAIKAREAALSPSGR